MATIEPMPHDRPRALLGGLSARDFMRKHWQRRPLCVRGALDPQRARSIVDRVTLFELAARDDVESRLVVKQRAKRLWQLVHGPIKKRHRPSVKQADWTLLVQGVDLHRPQAHALLRCFDFLPQARLDDVMVSYATDGGGVGPHLDAYDVFLVQLSGQRRWFIGPVEQPRWQTGQPLKLLRGFKPQQQVTLGAGDMLYLPPGYGHDGVAVGESLTASVGFRAPSELELVQALMPRVLEALEDEEGSTAPAHAQRRYADRPREPSDDTAQVPAALQAFARRALKNALLAHPSCVDMALGEWLSEPKPQVWFQPRHGPVPRVVRATPFRWVLDRRTKMLHDDRRLYINGQAFDVSGHDAQVLRKLAHRRWLSGSMALRLSRSARRALEQWAADGWLQVERAGEAPAMHLGAISGEVGAPNAN